MNGLRLARHVIHQQILAERVGSGEVGFAAAHLRNLLHELHQAVIGSQHEGIDQDAGAFALRDFFERLADHQRIETEGILVDPAIFERERGRLCRR